MSRPKNYWNPIVKKMIFRYPMLQDERTIQAGIFEKAIKDSLKETRELTNGDMRIRAIEDIYFKRIKTYEGAALELNFSERTIRYWCNDFVKLVGKHSGYTEE